jgi:hypothetical protein
MIDPKRLSAEEIADLKHLVEYRKECGLLFVVETDEWEGPTLKVKVKGYDASNEFVVKYFSALDDIAPRVLEALEQAYAENGKLREALKAIADLSNGRVKRHIDDYGDIARQALSPSVEAGGKE